MISWEYECNIVQNFALDHWDLYSSISGMNNINAENQLSMKKKINEPNTKKYTDLNWMKYISNKYNLTNCYFKYQEVKPASSI